MSPRQALQVLDQVAERFMGNRSDHDNIKVALAVLQGNVIKQEEAEKRAAMKSAAEKANTATSETQTQEQEAEAATPEA